MIANRARKIESAGGVVIATDGGGKDYVAVVQGSDGKWRLPKGHREPSESLRDAAIREVHEETGLSPKEFLIASYLGSFELNEFEPLGDSKFNHFFLIRLKERGLPALHADSDHAVASWAHFPAQDLEFAYDYQRRLLAELSSGNPSKTL